MKVSKGHNRQLMEACKPLADYADLVDRVRAFKSQSLPAEAVDKARETAAIMLAEGEPLDKIVRYTGLSIEEIKKITN